MASGTSLEGLNELSSYAFATKSRLDPQLLKLAACTPPPADCPAYNLTGWGTGKARDWLNFVQRRCLVVELSEPSIYERAFLGWVTVVCADEKLGRCHFLRPNV